MNFLQSLVVKNEPNRYTHCIFINTAFIKIMLKNNGLTLFQGNTTAATDPNGKQSTAVAGFNKEFLILCLMITR